MLLAVDGAQFRRDAKRAEKRGKDMSKLRALVLLLLDQQQLPAKYRDHALKGEWSGMRDVHIEPDWLVIYYVEGDELHLIRTGSHADLFDE
jgi:mRNA interferase YafQ